MSIARFVDALRVPSGARVDRRVPKKLLLEHGAPTAGDKRHIQDGIDDLRWVAALKPSTVGVAAFRDDIREYVEVAVLTATLRNAAKTARLTELIHRSIPYPLVLWTEQSGTACLSLAHKRWSQGQVGQVVIEEMRSTAAFRAEALTAPEEAFLASLALSSLPAGDLYALYEGWIDRVAALEAASITGAFAPPATAERAAAQREALATRGRLQREVATLRAQAEREKQVSRRVELNLSIRRLEAALADTAKALQGAPE